MLRHGRAPKGADVVEPDYEAEDGGLLLVLISVSSFFLLAADLIYFFLHRFMQPLPHVILTTSGGSDYIYTAHNIRSTFFSL